MKLLQNLDDLCTEPKFRGGIIYSEETTVPREKLNKLGRPNQYQEGLPEKFGDAHGAPSLIILDDLLNRGYGKEVCDLFTKGSHHINIRVLLLTQNVFHQGSHCRDISLKAKYMVLLKNVRDKNQFLYLARQPYPEDSRSVYEAYLDATRQPHGYLILDFAQDTDERLSFRTNVFIDEHPPTVYATVNNETPRTIELS